mgnify:CR=1 FL=1
MSTSRRIWWACDDTNSPLIDLCGYGTHDVVEGDGYQVITLKAAINFAEAAEYHRLALVKATANRIELRTDGVTKSCQINLIGELKSSVGPSDEPRYLELSLTGRFSFDLDDWQKLWARD